MAAEDFVKDCLDDKPNRRFRVLLTPIAPNAAVYSLVAATQVCARLAVDLHRLEGDVSSVDSDRW